MWLLTTSAVAKSLYSSQENKSFQLCLLLLLSVCRKRTQSFLTLRSGLLLLFSKVFRLLLLLYVGGKVLVKRGFWALNSRLFRLCFKHYQITLRLTIHHHPEMRRGEKKKKKKGAVSVSSSKCPFFSLENFWLTFGTAAVDMKKLSPSSFPLLTSLESVLLCSKLLIFILTFGMIQKFGKSQNLKNE